MKYTFLLLLLISLLLQACKKENSKPDTLELLHPASFLKNIPVSGDTIYMDKNYGIDFRVQIDNYEIKTINITLDNQDTYSFESPLINTFSLPSYKSSFKIKFQLIAVHDIVGPGKEMVVLESGNFTLEVVENLSERYVKLEDVDGRLKITWPELDKEYTQHYLIERFTGDKEIKQEIVNSDSVYSDPYYVGEEVTYNISVINKDSIKQNIWHIHREKAHPGIFVSQNGANGYVIKWNKCQYAGNLGYYNLYKSANFSEELLFNTSNVNDTTYILTTGKFGEEARFQLEYIPKAFPTGITITDKQIYSFYLYKQLGEQSLIFDHAVKLDENTLAYTRNGKIYKYSISQDKTIDSIYKSGARYGFLNTSMAANYIIAADENIYGTPIYIWPAANFQNSPQYTFNINFIVPPISDVLTTIMGQKSATTDSKLAIFDASNGSVLYATQFQATSNSPRISSNGQFLFIDNSGLGLYRYQNNTLTRIWQETDWTKYYRYYNFDPLNPDLCYLWDGEQNFSIKNVHDFSTVNSYPLNIYGIANIDFNTGRMMGSDDVNLIILNLADGTVIKQIPADAGGLNHDSNTLMVGNTIFHTGIKYNLNLK